jgi:hypothetical protein
MKENIKKVLQFVANVLINSNSKAEIIGDDSMVRWESNNLPYEELQDILMIVGETEFMLSDFNFYCKAHKGDSIAYQLTLHIKELEPKP